MGGAPFNDDSDFRAGKHRSRSADTATIRRVTREQMKLVERYAPCTPGPRRIPSEYDSDSRERLGAPVLLSDLRASSAMDRRRSNTGSPGLHRAAMNLEGLVTCRPALPPGVETLASLSGSHRKLTASSSYRRADTLGESKYLVPVTSRIIL